MSKITDYFKVGDKVKWIKVREKKSGVEIMTFTGTIEEIFGSKARINSPDFPAKVDISLFELLVIES